MFTENTVPVYTLKTKAVCSFETFITIYNITYLKSRILVSRKLKTTNLTMDSLFVDSCTLTYVVRSLLG